MTSALRSPVPASALRRSLDELWRRLDLEDPSVAVALAEAGERHPALAGLLELLCAPPRQHEREDVAQEAWRDYLQRLSRVGQEFAAAGVAFDSWRAAIGELRSLLLERLSADPALDKVNLLAAASTLSELFDLASGALGAGFLDAAVGRARLDAVAAPEAAALAEELVHLKRANAELQQLASRVSHDLRAPLRVIAGLLLIFEKRHLAALGADAAELVRRSIHSSERMSAMLEGLVAYARVTTRGQALVPTRSGDALRSALAYLADEITRTRAEVSYGPLPTVLADRVQLTQVFQQLVGNALRFCSPHAAPAVEIDATQRGDRWTFSIADNGIGVDRRDHARIFDVFVRLHPPGAYPGSGMGLPLCKRIIERHGGDLQIESVAGRGATLSFTMRDAGRV
ncbi:MAG: ATP-binding protein [Nannocystaceae bacterium]